MKILQVILPEMNCCVQRRRHEHYLNHRVLVEIVHSIAWIATHHMSQFWENISMCGTGARAEISYSCGDSKSILMMSESQSRGLSVLVEGFWFWLVFIAAGLPAPAVDLAPACHTWELDAVSLLFEFSATGLHVLATWLEQWLVALRLLGL